MGRLRRAFTVVATGLVIASCANLDGLADGTPEAGALVPDVLDSSTVTDAFAAAATDVAETSVVDASADAQEADVSSPEVDAGPCTCLVPAGWQAVTTLAGKPNCKSGAEVVTYTTSATAGAGACGCDVTNAVAPSCTSGTLSFKIDSNATDPVCNMNGASMAVTSSACMDVNGVVLANHTRFDALPAKGGSCTATPAVHVDAVTKNTINVCVTAGTCPQDFCADHAPSGEGACIMADGDMPCPGIPFTKKIAIGADFNLACSACTCAASATCTNVTASFYKNGSCTGTATPTNASNTCAASGANTGAAILSMKYTATATSSYVASGPKTPTITLTKPRTLCCVP